MEDLAQVISSTIFWVQPRISERQFELRTQSGLLGTLHFENVFGTLANAFTADGRWTFKRVGFLNPRVTIREAGGTTDLAVYWPRLSGYGWLEFGKGNKYQWKPTNFWGSECGFFDIRDELVYVARPGQDHFKLSDLVKTQALVEIGPSGRGSVDLPLLLMLGWYLMILQQEDAAVLVATTVAT